MDEIENIYTGVPEVAEFDLKDVLYYIGEDIGVYEDWNEDVYEDLMSYSETRVFLNIVKQVLKKYKVYIPDDNVFIDINF